MPGVAARRSSAPGRWSRRSPRLGAFYALARSLQLGDPIDVIVVSSIAANVAAIVGGVLVFGDPVGSNALAVVARCAAFAAVIVAAALIPAAPRRRRSPHAPDRAA